MRTQNETYVIELNKLNFLKEDLLFPSQDAACIVVSSQVLSRARMAYWRRKRKEKQNLFSFIYHPWAKKHCQSAREISQSWMYKLFQKLDEALIMTIFKSTFAPNGLKFRKRCWTRSISRLIIGYIHVLL